MGANHTGFEKDILGLRRKNPAMNATSLDPSVRRPDYKLSDNLWARQGAVFITGTQALVRLLVMQRERDVTAGLNAGGDRGGEVTEVGHRGPQ